MHGLKNLKCLRPETADVLKIFADKACFLANYVLAGGSALTLHICHRKSEDLYFFTFEDSFNKTEILDFLSCFKNRQIINDTDEQIDLLCNNIKVTFFNAKWNFLRPLHIMTFNLASLENIAAMKIHTLFLRAKFRDYYDVYSIAKSHMSLQNIYDCSQKIIPGINYRLFCTALTYIDDIEDDDISHLEPEEPVTKQAIRAFFEKIIIESGKQ
jgi:predicted nucleotidyltransferase component of viral defense system